MSCTSAILTTLPTSSSMRPSNLSCSRCLTRCGVTSANCCGGTSTVSLSRTRLYMLWFRYPESVSAPEADHAHAAGQQAVAQGAVVGDDGREVAVFGQFDHRIVRIRFVRFDYTTPIRKIFSHAGSFRRLSAAGRQRIEFDDDGPWHEILGHTGTEQPVEFVEQPEAAFDRHHQRVRIHANSRHLTPSACRRRSVATARRHGG